MKILIIEDDDRIAAPLKEELEHQHNLVQLAFDGEAGFKLASENHYDLILLDLMIPGIDGLTICRKLRDDGCNSAIIMISARDTTANTIQGLDCGADDYLAKPFEIDELVARIRAVMRRGSDKKSSLVECGELKWNAKTLEITFRNQALDLTPTEYRLLTYFMTNPNQLFSKKNLLERLWQDDELVGVDVIKTHIKGLRKKLNAVNAPPSLIESVYGVGYRLNAND